jgi:hypothetical protein
MFESFTWGFSFNFCLLHRQLLLKNVSLTNATFIINRNVLLLLLRLPIGHPIVSYFLCVSATRPAEGSFLSYASIP